MDEDNQEDRSSSVAYHRSPIFRKNEVKALVDQIVQHKNIILNKCTNSSTNQAKEEVWEKICKEINKQGFEHKRTADVLKTKWLNLKREAKKVSKNIIDSNCADINNVLAQVVMIINENGANTSITEIPQEDKYPLKLEEINDTVKENDDDTSNLWDDNNPSDESNDGDDRRGSRSLNFTPSECSRLLRCVRDEKDNVLCKGKGGSGRAVKIANSAWSRITYKYNKQSTLKRSTKMLRTKFANMKRLANFKKYVGRNMKHETIDEQSVEIKYEPNDSSHLDVDKDDEDDMEDDNDDYAEMHVDTNIQNEDNSSDPLCMVLNGDSGIESIGHSESYNSQFNNKEVVKLKLELLKYQLETAKLERQRVKDALDAETSDRQSKAIETSLRLRAARLDAVASESKLSPTHPALQYSDQEKLAKQYLRQHEHTNCAVNKSESDID